MSDTPRTDPDSPRGVPLHIAFVRLERELAGYKALCRDTVEVEELARIEAKKVLSEAEVDGTPGNIPSICEVVKLLAEKITSLRGSVDEILERHDEMREQMRDADFVFDREVGKLAALTARCAEWRECAKGLATEEAPPDTAFFEFDRLTKLEETNQTKV